MSSKKIVHQMLDHFHTSTKTLPHPIAYLAIEFKTEYIRFPHVRSWCEEAYRLAVDMQVCGWPEKLCRKKKDNCGFEFSRQVFGAAGFSFQLLVQSKY